MVYGYIRVKNNPTSMRQINNYCQWKKLGFPLIVDEVDDKLLAFLLQNVSEAILPHWKGKCAIISIAKVIGGRKMGEIGISVIVLIFSAVVFYFCCLLLNVLPSKSNTIRWLSFLPLTIILKLSFSAIFLLLFGYILPAHIIVIWIECFSMAVVLGVCVYKIIPSHRLGILYTISVIWILLDIGEMLFIEDSSHSVLFWLGQIVAFIGVCLTERNVIKREKS